MAWLDLNTLLIWTLPIALFNPEFESFILVYSCPINSVSLPVCSVCSGIFLSCSPGSFQGAQWLYLVLKRKPNYISCS